MTPDERLPAVPDVDETDSSDRDTHYGGKVYKWPSRVAIVGYGVKAGIPPRVKRIVKEVEDFSQQYYGWEVRLNQEMHTKTL